MTDTNVENPQTRTTCTMADLEAWCAAVELDFATDGGYITRIDRTYPPCIGCGGDVFDRHDNALTIRGTTISFRPCGCVLTVTDMPDGPQS